MRKKRSTGDDISDLFHSAKVTMALNSRMQFCVGLPMPVA